MQRGCTAQSVSAVNGNHQHSLQRLEHCCVPDVTKQAKGLYVWAVPIPGSTCIVV